MTEKAIADWVARQSAMTIEPRSYQLEAWRTLWSLRKAGERRALVHLATGLGKTTVAAVDALRYKQAEKGGRILFVCHVADISAQAKRTFQAVNPQLKAATYRRGLNVRHHDAVFATFQGLYADISNIDAASFDYIVWDEAHHIEARTFKAVREHFTPKFELGLTATPERTDGRDILEYFGQPAYVKSLADGMAEGWLSPVDYHLVMDETLKKAVSDNFNVDSVKELRSLFQVKVRDEVIVKEVAKRREQSGLADAKTIVFCHSVTQANDVARLLGGKAYHAKLTAEKRKAILTDFRNGDLSVICTVDMFNEGIDIPDARLVVFLRSTSSRTIFEQQLGRGLRRAPGKEHVTVLDFVANVERINFVAQLGRHLNRREDYKEREGTGGGGRRSAVQFNFGTSFEFDDIAIRLLDKYESLRRNTIPDDYVIMSVLAAQVGLSQQAVAALTRRRLPRDELQYFAGAGGRKVLALSPEQAENIRQYFATRKLQTNRQDEAVALYQKTGSVTHTAKEMGVSYTQAKKYLTYAGVYKNTYQRNLPPDEVVQLYRELGSAAKVAKQLKVSPSTIQNILRLQGYTLKFNGKTSKYPLETMVAAYERNGRVLRRAALELGINYITLRMHLKRAGYNTDGRRTITEEQLQEAYRATDGKAKTVAVYLGISKSLLYHYRSKYGLVRSYKKKEYTS